MLILRKTILLTPILMALSSSLVAADLSNISVGVDAAKIGNIGNIYGVHGSYHVNPNLQLNLGYSRLNYQHSQQFSNVNFSEDFSQKQLGFSLDWFPWSNGFYASAGVVGLSGEDRLTGSVDTTRNYTLNGRLYTGTQLGGLTGTIKTKSYVPQVGMGYRHYFSKPAQAGWYTQASVNYVFGLSPELTLSSSNPSGLANLPSDLQAEAQQETSKIDDAYALYGLSIGYRF